MHDLHAHLMHRAAACRPYQTQHGKTHFGTALRLGGSPTCELRHAQSRRSSSRPSVGRCRSDGASSAGALDFDALDLEIPDIYDELTLYKEKMGAVFDVRILNLHSEWWHSPNHKTTT